MDVAMTSRSLILILISAFTAASAENRAPEQVHIAFGHSPDVMNVQWATMETFCSSSSTVEYGLQPGALNLSVEGECFPFDVGAAQLRQSNHVATMIGLRAYTKYYYRVGGDGSWSEVFNFRTAVDAETLIDALPHRILVYGDLGSGASQPEDSSTIMPWASLEVQSGKFDMLLHVGDFAYDFDSKGGTVGRRFMNEISNMSAFVPYMVDHGNHESSFNFAHYTEFFRNQPRNLKVPTISTDNGEAPNNWFFSWNMGLVHFVTISSEVYFDYEDMVPLQWEWLKQDLAAAQANRTNAPWIVVNSHRGLYCSCDDDCFSDATRMRAGIVVNTETLERQYGIEELLYGYGVDLFINGHEHNYERMYDIAPQETGTYLSGYTTQTTTNPPATIYIVTGDAGNDEDHEEFKLPQPARTAFRTSSYGYSRMTVHNATHLYWEQIECDTSREPIVEGDVIDSFWLIQESHGPFSRW